MIPTWLYTGAFYGCLGCVALSLLWYAYGPKAKVETLPRASIKNTWAERLDSKSPPRWRSLLAWLPAVAFFGGAFGAWMIHHVAVDVIYVHDEAGHPVVERMKRLGEPSYPLAPGEKLTDLVGYDTWVLNESSRPVRIEIIRYGASFGFDGESPPTVIPPGTAVQTSGIEYLGPDHQPPSSLGVEGFEAKMPSTSRSWLTWD